MHGGREGKGEKKQEERRKNKTRVAIGCGKGAQAPVRRKLCGRRVFVQIRLNASNDEEKYSSLWVFVLLTRGIEVQSNSTTNFVSVFAILGS